MNIRNRIINASLSLVHAHGFHRTTLAQFAKASRVPLGNFYYYFKTKESLGKALIERRVEQYRFLLAEWEKGPSPKKRILSFIDMVQSLSKELTACGCPVGSVTQELSKEGGALAKKAGAIFTLLLDWTAEQFKSLGYSKEAQGLALQLMSSLQGATVVANALKDESLLTQELNRLVRWIQDMPSHATPKASVT